MRLRGDLCVFVMYNECHELIKRQRCANVIRVVFSKNFHRG